MKAWSPQPGPQSLAIGAPFVRELLFGGARGGGKSDFLLGDFLQDVPLGSAWQGIVFRRSYKELEELVKRGNEIYKPLGAEYKVGDSVFVFPNGASLKMRHLEKERDADNYQGHQYTWVGWDELTNWENINAYNKLKACVRSAQGVDNKRIRASANPGGVGHHWVKEYFINDAPMGMQIIGARQDRMFIPSKLTDNKILMENDPEYIENLRELGSEELVRMWLDGDWSVITGAFFPEFSLKKHVVQPFVIPKHWMRFRSMDWGSASPFSVSWYAVASEAYWPFGDEGKMIPAGALVQYRMWYGALGQNNKGLRLTATQVALGIKEREAGDRITYGVIDPSAYKQDGGPSIAERMAREKVLFRRADNSRQSGWDQVRDRLVGNEDTGPMLYIFSNCSHAIRTLPALPMDPDNPEDADTTAEDHYPDDLRYACMSRPWRKPRQRAPEPVKTLQTMTYDDLWTMAAQEADNAAYRPI
jgi:hypothetical protein